MRHRRTIALVPAGAAPAPQASRGRGTGWDLAHRFTTREHEAVDDGWGSLDQQVQEVALPPATQVIEEQVKTILSPNESPDIGFDLSVNPYRGCEHVMWNSLARSTHPR
jgi:hypothetical protein